MAVDRVLECAPLRDAVYRNRTPDRGLRHAVSLGCLPFRSFAAVAPWLPPWDIVPPAEACAKVESLYVNVKSRKEFKSLQLLQEVADIVVACVHHPTESLARSEAPFANVKALTVRFQTQVGSDNRRHCDLAIQRLLLNLPSVLSVKIDGTLPYTNGKMVQYWAIPIERSFCMPDVDLQSRTAEKDVLAAYHRLPRLTSVDSPDLSVGSAFFKSLLLCRGTMKKISWTSPRIIHSLIVGASPSGDWSFDKKIHHAADAPSSEGTPARAVNAWIGNLPTPVPVHWTLERLVVTSQKRQRSEASLGQLMQLVRMCPRLRTVKLDYPAVDDWQTRRVLASETVLMSPEPNHAPSPKEADVMATAHRYVQAVVAAYGADRGAVPAARSRHRPALDRIVANGSYPAALLWAFSRGPEHTTLVTVDLGGALAEDDAAEAAAVVAIAARFRRQSRRGPI